MHLGEKTPWRFQLPIHKRSVKDQLCSFVSDLRLTPLLHLPAHWFKASLNPINAHYKCVDEIEAFGVLGQDRRELAAERHVGANEHTQAGGQTKAN